MKNLSMVLGIIGIVLFGCSQGESVEADLLTGKVMQAEIAQSKANTDLDRHAENLSWQEKDEEAILVKAENSATKEPGIVNMANPQYKFSIGDQIYRLWMDDVSGVIMNMEDTATIYTLSAASFIEVKALVESNSDYWINKK